MCNQYKIIKIEVCMKVFKDKSGDRYTKTHKIVSFKKTFWVFSGLDKKYLTRIVRYDRVKETMKAL